MKANATGLLYKYLLSKHASFAFFINVLKLIAECFVLSTENVTLIYDGDVVPPEKAADKWIHLTLVMHLIVPAASRHEIRVMMSSSLEETF